MIPVTTPTSAYRIYRFPALFKCCVDINLVNPHDKPSVRYC